MILRSRFVALMFGVLGALGELFRTLAGFRLRTVACRGFLPVVDLLLQCRLGGLIGGGGETQLALFGRGLHAGAANALGLEEGPEVGRLDILADRFGLRALAE